MTQGRATVVLDIGKTLSKLSLWRSDGTLVERVTRPNERVDAGPWRALDVHGITLWLGDALRRFAGLADIGAIIPVAHGAAAAVVRDGRLCCPPFDYESPIPAAVRQAYDALRDPFARTGSPALPDGLNLGAQLYWLGLLHDGLYASGTQILTWPQYWSWCLSGVAASEVTSLGCHTDLWCPATAQPSQLAERCGWSACLPPLRGAGEALGAITPDWAARTGLRCDTRVHCGLHDSNAALVAARAFSEVAGREATVLSTGTWFIAMRTPAPGAVVDLQRLPEGRDCLVNVDVQGRPVPSARFMGGREIEVLTGDPALRIDVEADQAALLAAIPPVLASGGRVLPTFAPGCGPYPDGAGHWNAMPADRAARRAATGLYAALVTDTALDLIGSCETLLIEGRFARAQGFTRALASLRPGTRVFTALADNDVSYGALRLLDLDLPVPTALREVLPLDVDLRQYAQAWRDEAQRGIRTT